MTPEYIQEKKNPFDHRRHYFLAPSLPPSLTHPLEQAHLLEVGAGIGQPLKGVRQVIISAEVETVCRQHIIDHGQEGFILLRLEKDRNVHLTGVGKMIFSFARTLTCDRGTANEVDDIDACS